MTRVRACVFSCVCVCVVAAHCLKLLFFKPCKLWWVGGRTVDWLAGWCAFGSLPCCTNLPKKKKGKTFLPFQSRVCAPRRAEAAWHLGSCFFCAAPWKWPPPFVPAARPLRPWANIQVKQWQTLSRFRRSEMGRGGGVQDLASEFFFSFCLFVSN